MASCERLLRHIVDRYDPDALILYGSWADGTNGPGSDFDALAVGEGLAQAHDTDVVEGVPLDLFVYPAARFDAEFDPEEIIQIDGGRIILDRTGIAARLMASVRDCIDRWAPKPRAEVAGEIAWCRKMAARARRGDAEGLYRRHWLLTDSLEIAFDALGMRYPGPRKALRWLGEKRPESCAVYLRALRDEAPEALDAWVAQLAALSGDD